jgi:hypothetical protein
MTTGSFKQLKEAWLQEQFSPDILEYRGDVVQIHLDQISSLVNKKVFVHILYYYYRLKLFITR